MSHMDVSENSGIPKSSMLIIRFSIINHPFWGTPIFGNTHIFQPPLTIRNDHGKIHHEPRLSEQNLGKNINRWYPNVAGVESVSQNKVHSSGIISQIYFPNSRCFCFFCDFPFPQPFHTTLPPQQKHEISPSQWVTWRELPRCLGNQKSRKLTSWGSW